MAARWLDGRSQIWVRIRQDRASDMADCEQSDSISPSLRQQGTWIVARLGAYMHYAVPQCCIAPAD